MTSLVTLLRDYTTMKIGCSRIKEKTKTNNVITWRQKNKDLLPSLCRKIKNIYKNTIFIRTFLQEHEAHFCSKFKNKLRTIQPQQKNKI